MRSATKRLATTAAILMTAWMFAAEHSDATMAQSSHHQATCQQIRAALQAGKSAKEVEKEFKVSSRHVHQCQQQAKSKTTSKE